MQTVNDQHQPPDPLLCPRAECKNNFLGFCNMFKAGEFDDVDFADGADCLDFKDGQKCERCGEKLIERVEHGYGADSDGNRGVTVGWLHCPDCD